VTLAAVVVVVVLMGSSTGLPSAGPGELGLDPDLDGGRVPPGLPPGLPPGDTGLL